MRKADEFDPFLEEWLDRYDRWVNSGEMRFSSKVIPVQESLNVEPWVLVTDQALEIVRNAATVSLSKCLCRTHYQRCDKPVEVCLTFNQAAERDVAQGLGRLISVEEAEEILRKANENGLVHLTVYLPQHDVLAVCSCCACCCHDLQIMKRYGRPDLMAHSEYIALTDEQACTGCGECVARCVFDARKTVGDRVVENRDSCFGCGLCVTACPAGAVRMQPRDTCHERRFSGG